MTFREASAASPLMPGAAGVWFPLGIALFPATRHDEFNADLATDAQVGFETAPASGLHMCVPENEDRADAGQHINTGNKQSRQRCAHCALGLETEQPSERVRGEHYRQRGVASRLGVFVTRAQKIASPKAPIFFGLSEADGEGTIHRAH